MDVTSDTPEEQDRKIRSYWNRMMLARLNLQAVTNEALNYIDSTVWNRERHLGRFQMAQTCAISFHNDVEPEDPRGA